LERQQVLVVDRAVFDWLSDVTVGGWCLLVCFRSPVLV
jgi:hypothetical protein